MQQSDEEFLAELEALQAEESGDAPSDDGSPPTEQSTPDAFPVSELCADNINAISIHAAAAALHGWNNCKYHTGEEMRLSVSDYTKALDALSTRGGPVPYGPAQFKIKTRAERKGSK